MQRNIYKSACFAYVSGQKNNDTVTDTIVSITVSVMAQTVGFEPTVLFSTNDFEGRVRKGKEGKLREDKGR